jgi:nicotinamidase-related amidase
MAIEFQRDHFDNAATLPMLVIVDPRARHIAPQSGISRAMGSGLVSRCRAALAFARSAGLTVSIVRGGPDADTGPGGWIKGLEPLRPDVVLERRARSLYSCEFFDEVAQAAGGDIALAGFLGDGGCLATAADALCAGHRVTILQDAVLDNSSQLFSEAHLRALRTFTMLDVRAAAVGAWIASLSRSFAWGGRCE